jgi:cystathionine beta-lyase/cystathionine gamma-synthase
VYNKTRTLLRFATERVGGKLVEVEDGDPRAVAAAVTDATRLVFVETCTNPLGRVQDIPALALALAERKASLPELRLVVDDTALTPWGPKRPLLEQGVDVVVGAGTKALAGDDAALWGYVMSRDVALMNRVMDVQAMRGGVLDGARATALAAGLEGARARFVQRAQTAQTLAAWLADHPAVERVWHPSVADHPDHAVAERDLDLPGSLVAFRLRGVDDEGHRHAADVIAMTTVFRYALSFDGLASKVNHHTTVSEYHTPPPVLRKLGLDRLIRLAPGVEDVLDLQDALAWALAAAPSVTAAEVRAWAAARSASLNLADHTA